MRTIVCVAFILAVSLTPALALAQGYQQTQGHSVGFVLTSGGFSGAGTCVGSDIGCVAQTFINIINGVLVPLLFAIAFIVFLYGIAKAYIFSAGEPEEVSKGHKLMLWGLIAFVVMISLWGLVNVVANTFGLYGSYAPRPPTSY